MHIKIFKKKISYKNMKSRCLICLKYYANKSSLKRHESVACKQKFECIKCLCLYSSRWVLKTHKCKNNKNNNNNNNNNNSIDLYNIGNILEKLPTDKQININININDNKNIEMNNNSKNTKNLEMNNNSKNNIMNNFLDTKPKNFMFDYITEGIQLNDLKNIDGYEEELADKYMYEEEDFKKMRRDMVYKYDKEKLETEGMKILFTRLQKDPMNRNVMIRKSKSGKCYIYETEWVEQKLQKIILKICNKLCDTLYDKETSMNHFFRLIIGSQPRRYIELRKHIEEEILNIKVEKLEMIDL